jgi:hypothetical protein
VRLGALSLCRGLPGALTAEQHADALVVGAAARWMLEAQAGARPDTMAAELEAGADFHYTVHNAAGFVSVQEGISVTAQSAPRASCQGHPGRRRCRSQKRHDLGTR